MSAFRRRLLIKMISKRKIVFKADSSTMTQSVTAPATGYKYYLGLMIGTTQFLYGSNYPIYLTPNPSGYGIVRADNHRFLYTSGKWTENAYNLTTDGVYASETQKRTLSQFNYATNDIYLYQ